MNHMRFFRIVDGDHLLTISRTIMLRNMFSSEMSDQAPQDYFGRTNEELEQEISDVTNQNKDILLVNSTWKLPSLDELLEHIIDRILQAGITRS